METSSKAPVVLVIDDEPAVLTTFETILSEKFAVLTAATGKEALDIIDREKISLIFLDIILPDMNGLDILRLIRRRNDPVSVIIATAVDCSKTAVEAMRLGACNYITKPFDVEEVMAVAEKALEREELLKEVTYLRSQQQEIKFDNIVGNSEKMKSIYRMMEKVMSNDATILISGESGTGKELIARAIHCNSVRKQKPFIPINCASIPESLLESELFGHERGAFTSAAHQKLGMFELADGGTLFLDEISALRLDMQAKLLRVLEEREIQRLGGTRIIKIDVRIISATNRNLKEAVAEGEFRGDLYYRLNVVPLNLPPLRERKEDIPLLIDYFLKRYNCSFGKKIEGISPEALWPLTRYDWPGNVRELRNIIERLVALKDSGIIIPEDLPLDLFIESGLTEECEGERVLKDACRDFERRYIKSVLERTDGNKTNAAKILGIHRNALLNKMKRLGLM